jgi:glycerol uptake facilitator-like aquaporin
MNLRPVLAEALGTALLLAAVVGSGIMAERLSGGNVGVALLANAVATGGALFPLAHLMFDLPILQASTKMRTGIGQWTAEATATFGLALVILLGVRKAAASLPAAVAFYIVGAYCFTASTSFVNPAVTIARSLSNTFAGIAPADVPGFIAAQFAGAVLAVAATRVLDPASTGSRSDGFG